MRILHARSFGRALLLALAVTTTPVMASAQSPAASTVHSKGDVTGDWQGTLQAGKALRIIFRISKVGSKVEVKLYSIDQTPQPFAAIDVSLAGSTLKLSVPMVGATYEGTFAADGTTLAGTFTQGTNPIPFTLVRTTKETAWELPAPAPPIKSMPADSNPAFDVATVKPNNSGVPMMQGLNFRGRTFTTTNTSLGDLVAFAYNIQMKQIVNGPDWLQKDRYDISGQPDVEGVPSPDQMRTMVRKLLADRFKLTIHDEKRDMSAFILAAAKGGPKLPVSEANLPAPNINFRPVPTGLQMTVRGGTVSDLCAFLQAVVLDRPLVNQTGLTGKYDISVTFTPDESQFSGRIPPATKSDSVEPAPSITDAFAQQLGLKLEAQKTAVPVIAIDRVEKPTAN